MYETPYIGKVLHILLHGSFLSLGPVRVKSAEPVYWPSSNAVAEALISAPELIASLQPSMPWLPTIVAPRLQCAHLSSCVQLEEKQ